MTGETCGWRRDDTFLPCALPPGHQGGHRPAIPKPATCGWCWGTHGCLDLPAGHDGDHECRMPVCDDDGNEVDYEVCDTRPQGDSDLFHMHWGEPGRGIEYVDPVKQAESDRYAIRFTAET